NFSGQVKVCRIIVHEQNLSGGFHGFTLSWEPGCAAVKGNFDGKQLSRALRYAMERQALITSLDMSRRQQLQFKDQFLSHVSHELRTPLTSIYQFTTILLDGLAGELNTEQREHLETMLRSAKQLRGMI